MDQMDIDHTVDVPDTPDRLAARGINGRNSFTEENHCSSMPCHSGQQKLFDEGSKDQPMVIDSGSRKHSRRPPKCTSISSNSQHPINSTAFPPASSSSSRNALLFRKGATEKNPSYQSHDSAHIQHLRTARPSCISKSSSSQDDSSVDLTEKNLRRPVTGKVSPSRIPGNSHIEFRKLSGLANGASSSLGRRDFMIASRSACEGTDNVSRVGSNIAFGEGVEFDGNIQNKHAGFLSFDPIASPRVNKQKRLVRNGCISPNNIAMAKQLAGKDANGSTTVANNNHGSMEPTSPHTSVDIGELVAEDNDIHTGKGKGVISHPCSSQGPIGNKNLHSRSSMSLKGHSMETSDHIRASGRSIEEAGEWRSTRYRTREMSRASPDEEQCLIRETDALRSSSQRHGNRLERREKGTNVATGDDYSKDQTLVSSKHVSTQPLRESASDPRARTGRLNGPHCSTRTLIKRQKQGSTSSSCGDCSTSVSDDPEVMCLSSSANAPPLRATSSGVSNLHPIIEVDEFSPQPRRNDHDEDARARQVEADEMLARELQEQLYNEVPVFGVEEVDEHIALALQHRDDSDHGFSQARHPVLSARDSLMSNLRRQSQSRSSSNVPRRGSLGRTSTLGRMTRLRSRFPGQPRTILPSRGRTSLFPPGMDVDMRMRILGALEEVSDMGVSTGILQAQRDFNENDYEMLLALDENNDQHGGAPIHLINGLPQSTVQSDNFEEACAICLDTPTIGDIIRHLPCLHKFHKDCIDPWLRRRTSCPVCKSSIT
ncbi:Receptor homology region, transmembrane domain- and RING domain-containing protein 6 [Sesamum alatum]|uniref:Receptor homology region, transmembrane domain-and RING domain-containing protein 6 n=1 Tax=Sesamum alatum TaxID=300844 RepID=A0AAE1Y0U4_9LAMI|nr:Receptor homology region, transmembrane domain- and RING domain-containing protein 6 [Sesamum alatum]